MHSASAAAAAAAAAVTSIWRNLWPLETTWVRRRAVTGCANVGAEVQRKAPLYDSLCNARISYWFPKYVQIILPVNIVSYRLSG